MRRRIIFWDQDDTLLKRETEQRGMIVNHTAAQTLERLAEKGFEHYSLSAKSAQITQKKAEQAGLEGYFKGHFDSRGSDKGKSMRQVRQALKLKNSYLKDNALYIGNSAEYDIINDVPFFLHIINHRALDSDFKIYENILDFLDTVNPDSYAQAFEHLFKRHHHYQLNGTRLSFHRFKRGHAHNPVHHHGYKADMILI